MHLKLFYFLKVFKVLIKVQVFKKLFFFHFFSRGENVSSDQLPVITLYTHDHCSLCDDLVEELEIKFGGRFQLTKIDITKKANLKFLRLYRLDIPVCFLNGQYLCKHSLNSDLLERRLVEIESNV